MLNNQIRDNSQIRVLLTGASGYLAGHVLNTLLERGYKVRGTVRSLKNPKKVDHLYKINPSKRNNLELVEADLSNTNSWDIVMKDVDYVVHTASPFPQTVPKNEDELIIPAVQGTEAIFEAALKHGVKKIVMTSSIASVFTGNTHKNFFTSNDWSNLAQSPPYEKSKTLAEKKAWEIYEKNKSKIKMTIILPGYIQGPSFHSNDCVSADFVLKVMKNELPGIPKVSFATIDVRDCALAHVIPLDEDKFELTNGKRYLLTEGTYWMYDLIQILKEEFQQYKYKFPSFTVESKTLLNIAGCMDKQIELIKPYFQRRIIYDNTPTMDDMNIRFRHHRTTILEFAYDLIKKGIIPNKLPKEVQICPEIIKS
ncbi:cinnamoyl-CoA reductase (macronuclear) [Tetrahymena thermophila SB210]|uniref:Cinnamoyl-CoA reductase n=1 Tax=Tetrahymena thermophila (strain SB210) TaxID=312017 RepID=I7MMX7_TETTS|nr:cinnamoyl-CoA reductase [Tetrahymena thermophila SB210]EAS07176.1 cinnamoyl-CoA reductase [Tetrahymena thermophila SB210]|eukprot:XP_001027418.1 cinnamoyl-CoA reductase [Tetrahymena thermophila SB210]